VGVTPGTDRHTGALDQYTLRAIYDMRNVMKEKTARKKATQSSKVGDGCWANNSAMEKMWLHYGITEYRSTK